MPSTTPSDRTRERASARDLSETDPSRVNPCGNDDSSGDEASIVEAARTDRAAFGVLYDRHVDAIYHYVACRVRDTSTAEDITAAVFLRALGAIERYQIRGVPFRAWLYRIASNLVANHHRHRKLLTMVHLTDRLSGGDPREGLEERTAVRAALLRLSEADQQVLALRYFAGLTPAQSALVLACSTEAVHKRLHRARARLRRELEGRVDKDVG